MRCGRCERKLVLDYLKHMANIVTHEDAPGDEEDKLKVAKTLRLVTRSIENGVHERGVVFLPLCLECGEEE